MPSGLMSLFAEKINWQVNGEVPRAIGLLPQLYEKFLASIDQTVVLLWKNCCAISGLICSPGANNQQQG